MEIEHLGTEVTMAAGPGSQQAGPEGPLGQAGLLPLWYYLLQHLLFLLGDSEGTWPAHCQLGLTLKTAGLEADLHPTGQGYASITLCYHIPTMCLPCARHWAGNQSGHL